MLHRRLFSVDPVAKSKTFHIYDDETKLTSFETISDVTDLMMVNHEHFKTGPISGKGKADGMRRVASIPLDWYFKWKKEGIMDDPVRLKQKLNDRDIRFLIRTSPERV